MEWSNMNFEGWREKRGKKERKKEKKTLSATNRPNIDIMHCPIKKKTV
jgi:hypothetical protein